MSFLRRGQLAPVLALVACSCTRVPQQRVIVGWNSPLLLTAPSDQQHAVGFSATVIAEAARRAGIEVVWHATRSGREVDRFLDNRTIDLSPAAVVTEARRARYYVTDPWWDEDLSVLVPAGGPQTEESVDGKTITLRSAVLAEFARRNFPHSRILEPAQGDAIMAADDVCSGRAGAALMPHRDTDAVIGPARPPSCAGVRLSAINCRQTVAVALMSRRETKPVADRLRYEIHNMTHDGTLAQIAARFPFPSSSAAVLAERVRQSNRQDFLRSMVAGFGILSLVCAVALVYTRRLHFRLRQANAQLETILDSVPEPMVVTDRTGKLVRVNTAYRNDMLMEGTIEGPHGRVEAYTEDGQLISPDRWPVNRVLRGETVSREDLLMKVDGIDTHRRFSGSPVRDRGGAVTHAVVSFFDITDQKRTAAELRTANDQLRRAETRLRLKHEVARIGTFEWFLNENRVRWSPEMEKLYGIASETHEHTFDEWRSLIHPDDLANLLAAMKEAVAGGRQSIDSTYRIVRPDGSLVWIHSRARYEYDAEGRPSYLLGVNMDISDIARAEEARARTEQELRVSNDELQAYAYTVSHDLQEPLRMVTSYVDLLARRYSGLFDDQAREFMDIIRSGALRMRGMLNDLLDYSRAGDDRGARVCVDANESLAVVRMMLQHKVETTGAEIISGHLPAVSAWPGRLEQILQNLVDNGLKYSRPGVAPRIRVDAVPTEGFWQFNVSDNGIGLNTAYADKIFRVFQRLHVRSEYSGNGVGLAVVRRLVERHGGRVWVDWSEPGEGSRFSFTLPRS